MCYLDLYLILKTLAICLMLITIYLLIIKKSMLALSSAITGAILILCAMFSNEYKEITLSISIAVLIVNFFSVLLIINTEQRKLIADIYDLEKASKI